jgi:two-component system sensor histidine kinase AlgZ
MLRGFFTRNKIFLLHLSFWVLYFTYRFYDIQAYLGYQRALTYLSVQLAFSLAASYTHYFFILPNLFRDKKPVPYIVKLVLLLLPVITARILTENQVFPQLMANENYFKNLSLARLISTTWDTLAFLIFTGMIRFTVDWFDLENKKRQLENEKLVAELNYLKAQINPHFLFNTLHNLNYLVYSGSSRATDVIIRLSNIMRYMIYDANKEKVLLKKEIAYMNDYIHLESIRLNQTFRITFNCHGESDSAEIAPLIMLTFLENAFKHGVSDQEQNCWIEVKLNVQGQMIYYEVSNKKITHTGNKNLKSGFGLNNVIKRLELSYPDKHKLEIHDEPDFYKVMLTLSRL